MASKSASGKVLPFDLRCVTGGSDSCNSKMTVPTPATLLQVSPIRFPAPGPNFLSKISRTAFAEIREMPAWNTGSRSLRAWRASATESAKYTSVVTPEQVPCAYHS